MSLGSAIDVDSRRVLSEGMFVRDRDLCVQGLVSLVNAFKKSSQRSEVNISFRRMCSRASMLRLGGHESMVNNVEKHVAVLSEVRRKRNGSIECFSRTDICLWRAAGSSSSRRNVE